MINDMFRLLVFMLVVISGIVFFDTVIELLFDLFNNTQNEQV